jgi:hypothetical protein
MFMKVIVGTQHGTVIIIIIIIIITIIIIIILFINSAYYKILVRKPKRTRPLGRPMLNREHNTKMDLNTDFGLDSPGSGQEPVVSSCEHGNEPPSSREVSEFI